MSVIGTDWAVVLIVSVTDGDTVRLLRRRWSTPVQLADGLETAFTIYDTGTRGVPIRLVNLDTPERGQPGYQLAREDLMDWINEHDGMLRVITYPGGGFDRLLGDIYVDGDIGNTASQHMLRDKNWPPYVRGK